MRQLFFALLSVFLWAGSVLAHGGVHHSWSPSATTAHWLLLLVSSIAVLLIATVAFAFARRVWYKLTQTPKPTL